MVDLEAEEHVGSNWIYNDLVLDAVFSFLSVPDLKQVRLSCRRFCTVAGRTLARKTMVYLTSETLIGSNDCAVNFPHETIWECNCERIKRTHNYFSVDHERFTEVSSHWSPDFRLKRISLLGCDSVYKLPSLQFGTAEELEITSCDLSSGLALLQNIASLFPFSKSITIQDVQPQSLAEAQRCGCCFCCFFQCSEENVSFESLQSRKLMIVSTKESHSAARLSVEQIVGAEKLPLRMLRIEVTPHSVQGEWEILQHFRKLEVLEMHWWGAPFFYSYPQHSEHLRPCFSDFLEKVFPYLLKLSNLKCLSLRFDLIPTDCTVVQTVLNRLTLQKLSLHIKDYLATVDDELLNFFSGLDNHVIEALDSVSYLYWKTGMHRPYHRVFPMEGRFSFLHSKNFFRKSQWQFKLRSFVRPQEYSLLSKTANMLVLQYSIPVSKYEDPFTIVDLVTLMQNQLADSVQYNYAVHRVESTNYMEILNPSAIFSRHLHQAKWAKVPNFICSKCIQLPRLLCDMVDFRSEAKIIFPEPHGAHCRNETWTFYTVPTQVLEKWSVKLDSEIEATSSLRTCNCACWRGITEFGRSYPGSITDITQSVCQSQYVPYYDPTMSSCGYKPKTSDEIEPWILKEGYTKMVYQNDLRDYYAK